MPGRGVKRPSAEIHVDLNEDSNSSDEDYQQPADASSDDDDDVTSSCTESSDESSVTESEPSDGTCFATTSETESGTDDAGD
jgi:hypothetical protein